MEAFADYLLDAWGRLLANLILCQRQVPPEHITQLDRLAIVENSGKVIRNYLMEYIEDWSVSGTYFGHKPIEITLLITA